MVKEGGGAQRLVVKLTMEKPLKGNPDLPKLLLGLKEGPVGGAALGSNDMEEGEGEDEAEHAAVQRSGTRAMAAPQARQRAVIAPSGGSCMKGLVG